MDHTLARQRVFRNALLTPAEMARADQAAIRSGTTGVALMEAAGAAVANAIGARWSKRPAVVLCGPGNNGGDGFVAARHLLEAGWPVKVCLLGKVDSLTGDAASHYRLWKGAVEPLSIECLEGAALVVDALFGAGLSRPIGGIAASVLTALAERKLPVCAVDVPSGVDGASGAVLGMAAPADMTVTFFRKKPAHLLLPGRVLCGELVVADIGIPDTVLEEAPPATVENGLESWGSVFPVPDIRGHKYGRGHALVVGGHTMTGAARLAALACARAGAGLVTIAAPAAVWPVYAGSLTSTLVVPLPTDDSLDGVIADQRKNVVLIGPGAGVSDTTRRQVEQVLAARRSAVLDADALTVFADDPQCLFHAIGAPCVLTPHAGEFARLFETSGNKLGDARRAAALSGAIVVLKGADTVIAAPDGRAAINANAPAYLATGGTGDVLAGLITGLMAQGMEAFQAACAAVWLHGLAADLFGPGLIADDLPAMIPRALRRLLRSVGKQDRYGHRT
jgi:NAD(P)H-hydrate epimerase